MIRKEGAEWKIAVPPLKAHECDETSRKSEKTSKVERLISTLVASDRNLVDTHLNVVAIFFFFPTLNYNTTLSLTSRDVHNVLSLG